MSNALTHIRKSVFGLTQAGFAEALGRSQSTVSRWEAGTLAPDLDDMTAIRKLAADRGLECPESLFFAPPITETARASEGEAA